MTVNQIAPSSCSTAAPLLTPHREYHHAFRSCQIMKGYSRRAWPPIVSASQQYDGTAAAPASMDGPALWRRSLLASLSAVAICAAAQPALAEELVPYEDARDRFRISVPKDWVAAAGAAEGNKGFTGASGVRRALAWYPESGTDTNVTVIVTNVGADYTSLGSFGSAEGFGNNLVSSMDRSFLLRKAVNKDSVQVARLLSAKDRGGTYFLEYTVQKPGEQQPRHFLSAVSLGYNGRYNRLYTVTAQCQEADVPVAKGTLESVLSSFKPPALAL